MFKAGARSDLAPSSACSSVVEHSPDKTGVGCSIHPRRTPVGGARNIRGIGVLATHLYQGRMAEWAKASALKAEVG